MSENSKIEWCDHTFNPWVGCSKVSPACDHCYAEGWAKRSGQAELWSGERRLTRADNWRQPTKWNARHERFYAEHGRRQHVFCASLADVFDNQVPDEWRDDLWQLFRDTPNLDWLLLTKRPQNIARMLPEDWGNGWPNVWLGTTVENQREADRRIPQLLQTSAAVRFLSCEPLLGPVDLFRSRALEGGENEAEFSAHGNVDWVIVGGESGPGARPMHPDWARGLRDQCTTVGTAFFFKQWGEWLPNCEDNGSINYAAPPHMWDEDRASYRVGKNAAGRLLDGRTWDEFSVATAEK